MLSLLVAGATPQIGQFLIGPHDNVVPRAELPHHEVAHRQVVFVGEHAALPSCSPAPLEAPVQNPLHQALEQSERGWFTAGRGRLVKLWGRTCLWRGGPMATRASHSVKESRDHLGAGPYWHQDHGWPFAPL